MWERDDSVQCKNQDIGAWVVQSDVEARQPCRAWMTQSFRDQLQQSHPRHLDDVDVAITGKGGFSYGRALVNISIPIKTAGGDSRPQILYRVVHKATPNGGIKARGHGIVKAGPLFFQQFLERHLDRRCRNPSPFMSATADIEKAWDECAYYEARGFEDIEILTITTHGHEWLQEDSRLWCLQTILTDLPLFRLQYHAKHAHEYLVQDSIPPSSVQRSKWDAIKHDHEKLRRKKKREYRNQPKELTPEQKERRKAKYAYRRALLHGDDYANVPGRRPPRSKGLQPVIEITPKERTL